MQVERVKYVIWAADMDRCAAFYRDVFGGEVIKQNDIKVDSAKVDALIETTASAYEDPSEVVEYYKANNELMQQMNNVALEEQAVEWVLEQAKVKEVKKGFDEIMNKQG